MISNHLLVSNNGLKLYSDISTNGSFTQVATIPGYYISHTDSFDPYLSGSIFRVYAHNFERTAVTVLNINPMDYTYTVVGNISPTLTSTNPDLRAIAYGDVVAVLAGSETVGGVVSAGKVFVYSTSTSGTTTLINAITSPISSLTRFGRYATINSYRNLFIGADGGDYVFVYTKPSSTYTLNQTIERPSGGGTHTFDKFGDRIHTLGLYLFIGDEGWNGIGAVHIYKSDGYSTYTLATTVVNPSGLTGEAFGRVFSVHTSYGVKLFVSAQFSDENGANSGRVDVFNLGLS
jgi:hypothetical protein